MRNILALICYLFIIDAARANPAMRGFPTAPSVSFAPPINPAISGAPGADKYLQSNASGGVSWAAKPPATGIPSGTGYPKQTAPGVFSNIALIPVGDYAPPGASLVPFSPAVPAYWSLVPTNAGGALDQLAAQLNLTNATAAARSSALQWSVGNAGTVATNSYLGRLNDTSATATSVSPMLMPCSGTLANLRAQRTSLATATATIQIHKAPTTVGVPVYASTGLTCPIVTGTSSCSQVASIAVTAGDVAIVRVTGGGWSAGAGTISAQLFCN